MFRPLCVFSLVLAACGGPVHRPDGGEGMLGAGSVAPNFAATDGAGHAVQLSEKRGTPSVVYFYPKDETPGCTKEACAFRDAWDKLAAAHVTVFGISRDSLESHALFREKFKLPFPLAADPDGTISRAYGVPSTLGMDARVTFLVGADGRIAKVYPSVDPAVHVSELLADVGKL
jgi:peroxiredoxin Q/BCP